MFGYILDLTGGISASLTSFVLPALTYLEATKGMAGSNGNDKEIAVFRRGCFVLAWFGAAIMMLVPTAVVMTALGKE